MLRFVLPLVAFLPLAAAELAVTEITLRHSETGAPAANPVYRAGEMVFLDFHVAGFKAGGDDNSDVQLNWAVDVADPTGRPVAETKLGEVKVQLTPEDKHWTPKVYYSVLLPPVPEPGTYKVTIQVEDKLGKTNTKGERTFEVRARKVPKLDGLGVANFKFLRFEKDEIGLGDSDAYHPGDTLWARFDIGGYKFTPQNGYEVRYSIQLKDATGKVVFEQTDAAVEGEKTASYPKQFTSGMFTVSLDKNVPVGEYSLVILLSDGISKQTAESAHTFRIEK